MVRSVSTLTSFLCWLDALPARYWFLVGITLTLVFVSALAAWFAPRRQARWNRPLVFATQLGLALFAYR